MKSLFKYNTITTFIIIFILIFFFMNVVNGENSIDDENMEMNIFSIDDENMEMNILAILDMDTRVGKEQKIALQVGVDNFNNGGLALENNSRTLSFTFMDYNGTLFQTVFAVQKLIKEDKTQVIIIGINNWQATTLIAKLGTQAKVPIISLASSNPITTQFTSLQYPFLVQMAHNATQQIHNLVSIIQTFHWHKVILIYEDNLDSCDYTMLSLLTMHLQSIGSQIENQILLPSATSTTNFKHETQNVLKDFINDLYYSRVFIVVKVSLQYVNHLFNVAKEMELMGTDSVWITLEQVTNLRPYLQNSTLLSMDGVLGMMTTKLYNSTKEYQLFNAQFFLNFSKEFPEEDYNEPSFQAVLAYDTITTIGNSVTNIITSKKINIETSNDSLLREILLSDFIGLSGQISFDQDHNTLNKFSKTSLVNIVGGNVQEIMVFGKEGINDNEASKITWPGNLKGRTSKGWMMPTEKKVMRIGVPVGHGYKNFIVYNGSSSHNCSLINENISYDNHLFDGFCIELFREVLSIILDYNVSYHFVPCSDPYSVLIDLVHNKTLDAVVGDVTILANRTDKVDFTLPFEESRLSIVVPTVESNYQGPWIFLKPFTLEMWLVTLAVLIYTMFIVWFLEHRQNEEFRGTWRSQLSTTIWFSFSSLYFAQRENISSGLARVVVVIWMFIVLILTQSYTANLSSMLTNARLNQTTIDIEMLRRNNAKVGYDSASFVNKFLEDLLQFNDSNIVGIDGGFENFDNKFKNGEIQAVCIDILYAQLFASQYCNRYTITNLRYRYGGLAYVFPKGSPIASDISEAILNLTENGKLMELENNSSLLTNNKCYANDDFTDNEDTNSLSLRSFWILFVFSIATATICFLASFVPLDTNLWNRITSP